MMDIVIPLLFMAIFYLGPELWKRYQAELYKSDQVREPIVPESKVVPPPSRKVIHHRGGELQSPVIAAHVKNVPSGKEEPSSWSKLDQNMIINGVIFAEILQPPRAYRPYGKK